MIKKIFAVGLIIIVAIACCFYYLSNNRIDIILTETEKEWLEKNPVIRVANELDWAPFDFNDSGAPKGLAIDHIQMLAEKLDLKLEYVWGHTWEELIKLFKQGRIDVMPVFYKNVEREEYTLFTDHYYESKLGVFIHSDTSGEAVDLTKVRVGMERAHGSIPLIKTLYSGIELIEIDYMKDLVTQLATKELDVIIGNPFVFHYHAKDYEISSIRLVDYINLDENQVCNTSMHIGVRKNLPVLHQLLEKAMKSVPSSEMQLLEVKWADVGIVDPINWKLVFQTLGLICIGIIALIWHNLRLKAIVRRKTKELIELNDQLEVKVKERTKELSDVNLELKHSLEEIKTLHGIIPICASCKKIRDDSGYWDMLEEFVAKHSDVEFSHSICPDCTKKLYPDFSGSTLFEVPPK